MKRFWLLSLLGLTPLVFAQSAIAQSATGLQGSYMGSTLDGSATQNLRQLLEGGVPSHSFMDGASQLYQNGQLTIPDGQVQGRLDLPNSPVSVRGVAYSAQEAKALMPMVSYDLAVSNNTNIYAGAGYAFVRSGGQDTPLGDRDGVVLSTGVEARVVNNLVLFGDAKYRLNADRNSDQGPVRLQFGVGYGF